MNNELIETISNLTKNTPEAVRETLVKLELGVNLLKQAQQPNEHD